MDLVRIVTSKGSPPNRIVKDSQFGKDSLPHGLGKDSQRCPAGHYALAMLAHSSQRDLVRIPHHEDLLRIPYQFRTKLLRQGFSTKWIW